MTEKKHRDMWREIYSDEETKKYTFVNRYKRGKAYLLKITKAFCVKIKTCIKEAISPKLESIKKLWIKAKTRVKNLKDYLLKKAKEFWTEVINCFKDTKNFLRQIVKEYWNSLSFCKKFYLVLLVVVSVPLIAFTTFSIFSSESVTLFVGPIALSAEQAMLSAEQVALYIEPFIVKILGGNKATTLSAIAATLSAVIAAFALYHSIQEAKYSRSDNRDNRVAKAAEMLGEDKLPSSHGSGLNILRDLLTESFETEYIRCVELVSYWLRGKQEDVPIRRKATDTFKHARSRKLHGSIKEYKNKYKLTLWPDLQNANLVGVDLTDVYLEEINLEGVTLGHTILDKANLKGACLINVELEKEIDEVTKKEKIKMVYLNDAILSKATLDCANLEKAELVSANLKQASLSGAILKKAKLMKANLEEAKLQNANLQDADLNEANLKYASLERAELQGANLHRANLLKAFISGVNMEEVRGLKPEQIIRATWKDTYNAGIRPVLPVYVQEYPDVQKWLKNPDFRYRR